MEHYLGIQTVSDKTVADCIEALIGVYLTVSLKYQAYNIYTILFIFIELLLIKCFDYILIYLCDVLNKYDSYTQLQQFQFSL